MHFACASCAYLKQAVNPAVSAVSNCFVMRYLGTAVSWQTHDHCPSYE